MQELCFYYADDLLFINYFSVQIPKAVCHKQHYENDVMLALAQPLLRDWVEATGLHTPAPPLCKFLL